MSLLKRNEYAWLQQNYQLLKEPSDFCFLKVASSVLHFFTLVEMLLEAMSESQEKSALVLS